MPQIKIKKPTLHRDYCLFLDSSKYSRNAGCKAHDNAYGIHGGGRERDRRLADAALLAHMREQRDPMAWPAYLFVRLYGWFYFNYHARPWRGQLIHRLRISRG